MKISGFKVKSSFKDDINIHGQLFQKSKMLKIIKLISINFLVNNSFVL